MRIQPRKKVERGATVRLPIALIALGLQSFFGAMYVCHMGGLVRTIFFRYCLVEVLPPRGNLHRSVLALLVAGWAVGRRALASADVRTQESC